jgi:hypothetical protein
LNEFKHHLGHVWARLGGGNLGEQQKMKKGSDEDWGEEQQMKGRLSCSPSSPFSSPRPSCSSFTVIHPSCGGAGEQ